MSKKNQSIDNILHTHMNSCSLDEHWRLSQGCRHSSPARYSPGAGKFALVKNSKEKRQVVKFCCSLLSRRSLTLFFEFPLSVLKVNIIEKANAYSVELASKWEAQQRSCIHYTVISYRPWNLALNFEELSKLVANSTQNKQIFDKQYSINSLPKVSKDSF